MTKVSDAAVWDAGGIVPGRPPKSRDDLDTVTARRYTHPVLDDTVVVRLVPSTLGEAEDLAMAFLGFDRTGVPRPVGAGPRRALGFPAWALVNDPANGRHALALVKEMERLARLAKSKPGNAMDHYEVLARRLGDAAPHFLPTYWEQAGRDYLAVDNGKMAGICFNRAREAERVHGLAIDEQRLADVHLEFALAGALPSKALQRYARDVAARLAPAEAYRQLRTVSVQRVAGGLAPHSGLAEDLSRLARAAKLNAEREAEDVVHDLLELPATAKASLGFWKSYRSAIVRLARRDPDVRGRLLTIMPDPPGWYTDISVEWIDLLEAAGAIADLLEPAPADLPTRAAGAWLERFLKHRARPFHRRRCPPLVTLVERMLPRLRAEGQPIDPFGGNLGRADLDVVDVLIAGGITVPDRAGSAFDVVDWLQTHDGTSRDLTALAAHAGLAGPWREGVLRLLTHRGGRSLEPIDPQYARTLQSVPGIAATLAAWLREQAEVVDYTHAELADLIVRLAPLGSPAGAALAPDAVRRIARADVAGALGRTLRTGLAGELGWPAFDEAVARLATGQPPRFFGGWPHLIVTDDTRVVVVGPDGIVSDHVLHIPPSTSPYAWRRPPDLSFVDGQLMVGWRDHEGAGGYWSARPDEVFDSQASAFVAPTHRMPLPLPLPAGGITTGGRPWHAGDHDRPTRHLVASDGIDYWRLAPLAERPERWVWQEYDPATGTAGRRSRPRFVEDGGDAILDEDCTLRPAAGADGSPLGAAGGLVGWRVGRGPGGQLVGVGVDGRSVTIDVPGDQRTTWTASTLVGALRLPGAVEVRALTAVGRYRHWAPIEIREPGTARVASRAEPGRAVPPHEWWHWMRPRDEAGSRALRGLPGDAAAALLKAAGPDLDTATRAVVEQLPEITDATLRNAVAEVVAVAAGQAEWFTALGRHADAAGAAASVPALAPVADDLINAGVAGLLSRRHFYTASSDGRGGTTEIALAVTESGALLRGEPGTPVQTHQTVDWPLLLGAEGALALRAANPGYPATGRDGAAGLLALFSGAGLLDDRATLRVLTLSRPTTTASYREDSAEVVRDGDRVTLVLGTVAFDTHSDRHQVRAIARAAGGNAVGVQGHEVVEDRRPAGWATVERAAALAATAAARGPWPWRAGLVADLLERTGISTAEATLLLAGLPGVAASEANFLPAETRTLLGLSVADARAARDSLRQLSIDDRVALLDAAMPADPVALWEQGPDVAGLAAAWIGRFGRRRALPEAVLVEATRDFGGRAVEIVRGLVDPDHAAWLRPDELADPDDGEWISPGGPSPLALLATALPWLAYRLSPADPARAALVDTYDRLQPLLRHSDLVIELGGHRSDRPMPPSVSVTSGSYGVTIYHVHADRLSGPDDPALTLFGGHSTVAGLQRLLSVELAAFVDALREPGPDEWPQDPRSSVPDLVGAVVAEHGLSTDAAAYYLQLLALPDPADRNVQDWTGWTAAAFKKIRAELAATDLVVEAKRARAGRSLFLPGGWRPLKAPKLPIEAWKAEMYDVPEWSLPITVLRPVPDLFRAAWQRVLDGDRPALRALGEAR